MCAHTLHDPPTRASHHQIVHNSRRCVSRVTYSFGGFDVVKAQETIAAAAANLLIERHPSCTPRGYTQHDQTFIFRQMREINTTGVSATPKNFATSRGHVVFRAFQNRFKIM